MRCAPIAVLIIIGQIRTDEDRPLDGLLEYQQTDWQPREWETSLSKLMIGLNMPAKIDSDRSKPKMPASAAKPKPGATRFKDA